MLYVEFLRKCKGWTACPTVPGVARLVRAHPRQRFQVGGVELPHRRPRAADAAVRRLPLDHLATAEAV
jgi:hypothetical protein